MPPAGPFQFVKEDLQGTNPKFTAVDADGVKWKVKLGAEARPETAATRLVWAVGYFTDEDYLVERAQLTGVPFNTLRRLKGQISPDSSITAARFERRQKGEKKESNWAWKNGDFAGTRELNGLRTLMALLNNWDLKDENNAIYESKSGGEIFAVSDLGASFGTTGIVIGHERSRGNLKSYEHSRFITHQSSERVDFACPGRPTFLLIMNPWGFFSRTRMESVGHHIPRADAKWIGSLLGRLSPAQIRDAFRAAGYSPEQVEGFARVVERRIAALNAL